MSVLRDSVYGLLRQSESYFKTDMVYVARGGLWTGLRFLVSLGASIASMVAFGNLLPKEVYGTYSYLLSLASSLAFFTLTGMGPGVIRAVSRGQENLLLHALRLQLRYNLLATATIGIAGLYYQLKGNNLFALSLGIMAITIPIESAYHIYEHVLIGRKRFDSLALLTSLSSVGSALATIIALFLTDNVLILVSVYAVMSLLPSFIIYNVITGNIPKVNEVPEEFTELRRSAFHITGAGVIGTLAQYVDKIVLFQVAGPASLAVYGFAIAGPEKVKGLIKDWVNIALPRLAQRDVGEIRNGFYKRITLTMVIGLAAAIIYILVSPILFKTLLPKYLDSIHYSQVYALGLIFIPALVYIGNIFYSQNMLKAIYITSTFNQVLRIIIVLIFAWQWQTWGIVIGFLVAQFFSMIFSIFIWQKESLRLETEIQ